MKILKRITSRLAILAIVAIGLSSSCGLTRLAKLGKQVTLNKIEKIEIKGLTGLSVSAEVGNQSPFDIAMEQGHATIKLDGRMIATLVQVGRAESKSHSVEVVPTLWRLQDIDPLTLLALSGRIASSDYSSMTLDYSAQLSAGSISRIISEEGVDLTKFLAIFTPQQ